MKKIFFFPHEGLASEYAFVSLSYLCVGFQCFYGDRVPWILFTESAHHWGFGAYCNLHALSNFFMVTLYCLIPVSVCLIINVPYWPQADCWQWRLLSDLMWFGLLTHSDFCRGWCSNSWGCFSSQRLCTLNIRVPPRVCLCIRACAHVESKPWLSFSVCSCH